VLSQAEVHELVQHLQSSLSDLQRLAPVAVQEAQVPAVIAAAPAVKQRVPANRLAAPKTPIKRARTAATTAHRTH